MIAIIDYEMGNLRSVQKALEQVGADTIITQNPDDIKKADKVVLPGVGAVEPAMNRLKELGLIDAINEAVSSGKPFLGICLGLQLLFDESTEGGHTKGLGIIPGTVERFTNQLKVPHMGWNQLKITTEDCPIYKDVPEGTSVYFCHSYYVKPTDDKVSATKTDYGIDFTSSIWKENIFGVQFHPEKSQSIGLQILKNFNEI